MYADTEAAAYVAGQQGKKLEEEVIIVLQWQKNRLLPSTAPVYSCSKKCWKGFLPFFLKFYIC